MIDQTSDQSRFINQIQHLLENNYNHEFELNDPKTILKNDVYHNEY